MDYESSKEYTLSIRLMPDGFSFSIHNVLTENSYRYEYFHFGSSANYLAALEESILQQEELLYPYRQIDIIVASHRFSLIPTEIYDADKSSMFYEFTITPRREKILTDHLEHTNAVNVYGIEEDVYGFLSRTFSNVTFHHHQSILIEYFTIKSKMGNTDKMICQLRNGMLDLLCFSKGKLRLANSFVYRTPEDAAYYILAAWKSIRMNQLSDSLQLTGDQNTIGEITSLLNIYIGSITPVVFPAQMFNLGKESLNAPFDLIALPLCV
ncbi:MAG: DUF3822 family protein [Bacteroidales bacterium]